VRDRNALNPGTTTKLNKESTMEVSEMPCADETSFDLVRAGRVKSKFIPAFVLFLTFGWIGFIWSYRFIPMEDYPLWLCAAKVFSQFMHGQTVTSYTLTPWPVPNSAFIGIVGLLDLLFPSEVSGKIFLTICTVLYALGSYLLVGSLTRRRDSALSILPMLFVFHRSVWAGELSFSFGMSLLLVAMAIALRTSRLSLPITLFISIGLFYSHAIPYFCWLIFLGALCIFDSTRFRRLKTLITVTPSLCLFGLYALHRDSPSQLNPDFGPMSALRETPRLWSLFSPLHFFGPFYVKDPHWVKTAALCFNVCCIALVAVLISVWLWKLPSRMRRESGQVKAVLAAASIYFVVFALFPFKAFTGVFDFNYRFLLPAFCLVLASLVPIFPTRRFHGADVACAALCVVIFYFAYIARVSSRLGEMHGVMTQADLGPGFWDITQNEFEPHAYDYGGNTGRRLLPVHDSLMYFADYVRLEHNWPSRMFTTSFLRSARSYPPLLGNSKWPSPAPCTIVIFGNQDQDRQIATQLPKTYFVAKESEYLLILKLKTEQSDPFGCL
jgi:hypothetical protein